MFRRLLLFFGFRLVYVFLVTGAAIGKIVEFGWAEYAKHFTNWSWTWQAFFYAATLAVVVSVDWAGWVVAWTFFPLVVTVFSVWLGSSMLLVRDPEFVTNLFEMWPPGVVMLGNDVLHVLPVLVLAAFALFEGPLVWYGLRRIFAGALYGRGPIWTLALVVWQTWGGVLLVVGTYRVFFDPNDVYQTDLPEASALGLVLGVGILTAFLPIVVLTVFHGLLEPPPGDGWAAMRQAVLLTRYETRMSQRGLTTGLDHAWDRAVGGGGKRIA